MLRVIYGSRLSKPISLAARVTRQGTNYFTVIAWLLTSVFKGRKKALMGAVALNLAHLAAQAAAIYVIYWYATQMEQGAIASTVWKYQFSLKDRPEALWVVVTIAVGLLIASAFLLFGSRRWVLGITEEYLAQSLKQIMLLSLILPDPRARTASMLLVENGIGALTFGCRRAALMAATFATVLSSFVGGAGALFFLFYLDPSLTLLILLGTLFTMLPLYPLTLRAVQSNKIREKAQVAFKQTIRRLIDAGTTHETPAAAMRAGDLARAYILRRKLLTEFIFTIEIGVTIILGVVVFYLASQSMAGTQRWAIFIAYIGSLRIALTSISQVVRAFASVSRFYPRLVRYYSFVKDTERIDSVALGTITEGDRIILGTLPDETEVAVTASQRLALVSSDPPNSLKSAFLHARLPHSASPLGVALVDLRRPCCSDAAIALVYFDKLDDAELQIRGLENELKNRVTLIVYEDEKNVGALGEEQLLTTAEGELRRFVRLGTNESQAALEEIAHMPREQRRHAVFDDDDEEDDEG